MDILATNCDSESCGCISAGDLTCIEHSKQSYCTYPSVDSINVYVGGVCSEDDQTLCFNDSQCSGTCDVTTDTGLLQEVSDGDTDNILLNRNDGFVWHQDHKHKFLFSTTRLDENISYWNSDYYLVEKSLEYRTSGGGSWQVLVDANDNINYQLGTQFNEVFDASSIVWDYLANPGSTKPIGSGEYRLRVRWPLSSINATPISTQSFNFNIEKKGCRDSSNSNFCDYGYNPFADIDCNDVYNGSNYETCCQMTDYLNSCCYLNEDDACGICPDSETYDTLVETWQDTDNDGIGCASSMVEYCPNQNIPSGRFTIDELTGLELGEACICNEANGFYTDDICYEAGVHEMCVTEQGTTNADDCGVCPYYTIGSTLLSTSLLNGDDFNVYYNNSADCAGICYDGFKPIQEIGGLLDRWSFITNAESFTGYNQLQLVGNDNNSITFDGGMIVNDSGDSIVKSDLFGMGNCDGETYNPERPYDNCPSHNIRTWSYWFSSDVSQTHISTEWRNPSNNDDFDHEVNIGMFQSNKIQIKWTNQNHNNDGGTQSPITVNSVSVDDYINGTLNDSQWHHVVVSLASEEYCISNPTITNVLGQTFDCETNKFIIFVDGLNFTPEIQNTPYTNMRYHHSLLVASGAGTGMGGGWTGKIKELRLYDKPLTAPETQALYLGTGGIMIGTEGHTFGSFEDDCLICSGGESNHIENENLDDCGTCHTPLTSQPPHFGTATDDPEGDWNAVCSDCWGTPNGDSSFLTDACGICTCPSGGNCTDLNGNVNDNLPNIGTCIDGTPNAGQSCLQFDYTANGYDAEVSGCGVGTTNTDCFVEGPDAGCGGVCFVYDTLDDINQCCLDGSKILVYPDYDLTAYSSPGVIGDGNCYLADVNENHNGCTGETGFCLDEDCFNPSGPVDETYCVDVCGSTWISAKTLTVCDPNIPGMQQPPIYFTGNIPSLNEEQVSPAGYPYDAGDGWLTAGEFLYYITTDVCLGYYDYCNECFSEEYLINNNLEIGDVYNQGVTCTGNCYDGYKEDSCEIWIGAGNEYQCRHPECVDFGYCSDNSGDDYNSCSANWIEYSFPEDYITFITENPNAYPPLIPLDGTTLEIEADNENYLSDACSTSDCPSGNCIPTNPLWNYTCTGCTDDQAKSTSYNEPCRTTHGLDGCLFDDGSCLYDIPIIESIDTVYIGPGGETIHGVVSNDIITEPVKFNIQFLS